jgi:hypothetical protein
MAFDLRRGKAGAMRLSGKSPKPEPVPARPRVHHPWDPPEAEIPAIVPISTLRFEQSEQAAVAITGLLAYSQGFEITVTRLIRPGVPGWTKTSIRRGTRLQDGGRWQTG